MNKNILFFFFKIDDESHGINSIIFKKKKYVNKKTLCKQNKKYIYFFLISCNNLLFKNFNLNKKFCLSCPWKDIKLHLWCMTREIKMFFCLSNPLVNRVFFCCSICLINFNFMSFFSQILSSILACSVTLMGINHRWNYKCNNF